MKPLFESDENWKKLLAIIKSWEGTPYRHLAMVKGRGADCTMFIGAIWKEFGIISEVEHEYYEKEWHIHTNEEKILNSFKDHWEKYRNQKYAFVDFKPGEEMMRGDLLTFSTTSQKVTNHASIYMGETERGEMMCHSINRRGVSYFPFRGFWKSKLVEFHRVMEKK
jgi:cell wall-associated NlpC family hydrolase